MEGLINNKLHPRYEEGLLLWNKLGSLEEIYNSEVGPSGEILGGDFYPAKFGNGWRTVQPGGTGTYRVDFNVVDNPSEWRDIGCAEVWFRPMFDSTHDSTRQIFLSPALYGLNALYAGATTPGMFRMWCPAINDTNCDTPALTFNAGDLIHLAFVWDFNGIEGTSDRNRIYVNGELKANNTDNTGGNRSLVPDAKVRIGLYHDSSKQFPAYGTFDNVKLWDYARTDFRNIFSESGYDTITNPDKLLAISGYKEHIIL